MTFRTDCHITWAQFLQMEKVQNNYTLTGNHTALCYYNCRLYG